MGAQYNSRKSAQRKRGIRKAAPTGDYDPLLPVQYYENVGERRQSGELKLSFAILEDALRCYVRTKNCRSGAKRAEFVDARAWFYTRGTPHVFSFESICAFLDIEPEWLRRKLESLSPADFPLKQFRTRRRANGRRSSPQNGSVDAEAINAEPNGGCGSGSAEPPEVTPQNVDDPVIVLLLASFESSAESVATSPRPDSDGGSVG